jgi:hypothetical protein
VANSNDGSNTLGRRQALQLFGMGLGALTLLGGTRAAAQAATLRCKDKVALDEAAVQLRRNLQYKEKAPDPLKKCIDCAQYEVGKYGDCGGCKVLPGGINPEGSCLSFAPKATAPGAKPAAPAPAAKPAPAKKG